MSEREDARLGELLRLDAPPERDALFRLRVIERGMRRRFKRRSLALLGAAIALIVMVWPAIAAGADLFAIVGLSAIAAGLAASCYLSAPGVRELLRRFPQGGDIARGN